MDVKAKARFLRVSPKKLRRIADHIRFKKLEEARSILRFLKITNKKYFIKVLNSVLANAKIKNPDIKDSDLYIKELYVDEGPRFKRIFPKPRGMAALIKKRTSHITVIISDGKVEKVEEK
ncbi:MAG: 50S ribosomal protein L22 [Spirochaetes bacterium]|nr:50S ribosomal protein L22 [Spirochaetota bacterium]